MSRPQVIVKIDEPVRRFTTEYHVTPRMIEFIQLTSDGLTYDEISEKLGLKTYYVQRRMSVFMRQHNFANRIQIMAKLYRIARDMHGLEERHEEAANQYLLRPDSVD